MNSPGSEVERVAILRRFRCVLGLFILALILSGITSFPLERELESVAALRGLERATPGEAGDGFDHWVLIVRDGLRDTYARYPWLAYGTDWLAFAHIVIATFFIGPLVNPVRNIWILQAGLIACVLIVPLALICGAIRHVPLGWRLIDCSFGILGAIPIAYCLRLIRALENQPTSRSIGSLTS
jgi:hypothetical protein